jgi:hypothetical protein
MSDIPHDVLSEAIQRRLGDARVDVAVFLTFRFDPGFFEQEVLPVLVDIPTQAPEVRLIMLEEALRDRIRHVAVYYDRNGLEAGTASAKLDVRRVPIQQNGYFHPKNVLLLVEDVNESASDQSARRLIVGTMSANLTRAGWWENIEVCHFEEVAAGEKCSFRGDLLGLIRRLKQASRAEERHEALDSIHEFVIRETTAYGTATEKQRLRPRFYCGPSSVPEWLEEKTNRRLDGCSLEVISPYFDETTAAPLAELLHRFRPREVRVLLPKDQSGVAQCSREYWQNVTELEDSLGVPGLRSVEWGQLPRAFLSGGKADNSLRRVHAKVYRFFRRSPAYEALFVGSVNLTTAGHARGGNFETGVLVETDAKRPGWWLEPDSESPLAFEWEVEAETSPSAKLGVRYSWDTGRAEAFWDDASESPPLRIQGQGAPLFILDALPPGVWVDLAEDDAARLAELLASTSFLTVIAGEDAPATILVQEEAMAHKPSLLLTLPVADILRYWSLLTPEQKAAFIEGRLRELTPTDLTILSTPMAEVSSMFSTFAGIFQAFGGLRQRLSDALDDGRIRHVVYYLFGRKYDSLPELLTRAQETANEGDPVQLYVVALCAKQLVKEIRMEHREFASQHRAEFKALVSQIDAALKVRKRLDLGSPGDRRAFLEWFESWFLRQLPPVPAESQ